MRGVRAGRWLARSGSPALWVTGTGVVGSKKGALPGPSADDASGPPGRASNRTRLRPNWRSVSGNLRSVKIIGRATP